MPSGGVCRHVGFQSGGGGEGGAKWHSSRMSGRMRNHMAPHRSHWYRGSCVQHIGGRRLCAPGSASQPWRWQGWFVVLRRPVPRKSVIQMSRLPRLSSRAFRSGFGHGVAMYGMVHLSSVNPIGARTSGAMHGPTLPSGHTGRGGGNEPWPWRKTTPPISAKPQAAM